MSQRWRLDFRDNRNPIKINNVHIAHGLNPSIPPNKKDITGQEYSEKGCHH